MNNTTLVIVALAAVAAGAVGALAISQMLAPAYGIILRATNEDISPEKWKEIKEKVLEKIPPVTPDADQRKYLYRVRAFNNGVPQGTKDDGEMVETQLLEGRRVPQNFTGHAFQIGLGALEQAKTIPANGPDMPQAHFRQNLLESKKMVDEVNTLLDSN